MLKVIQPGWSLSLMLVTLFWGHHCCVEYVNAAVCCIGEPQFSFIGREC